MCIIFNGTFDLSTYGIFLLNEENSSDPHYFGKLEFPTIKGSDLIKSKIHVYCTMCVEDK